MRLRNVKGSREEIARNPYVVKDADQYKGRWKEYLNTEEPVHIEIGMGKGKFLMEMARKNPHIQYIGIEKYSSVLLRAVQKREQMTACHNLLFLRTDAEVLTEVFAEGEVSGIYLNFSDPWPKDRHAHRRLPSRQFLARYEQVLRPGGKVEFKTDNQDLFSFALEEAHEAGWHILACTRNLHRDPLLNEGNIMTEYEQRFSALGSPICKVICEPPLRP